jgi:hypothetical protein
MHFDTKNYIPYLKLGWMLVKNGSIYNGIDNLLKALCLQPNNFEITVKLGEVNIKILYF